MAFVTSVTLTQLLISFIITAIAMVLYPYLINYKGRKALLQLRGPPIKGIIQGNLPLPGPENRPRKFLEYAIDYGGDYGVYALLIGPLPVFQVVGPNAIRDLLSSTKHGVKGFFYDHLHSWLGNGMLTSHGAKWKQRRLLTSPAFHFEVLKRFLDIMNEQSDVLITRLQRQSEKYETQFFDITPFISNCALDIISETAMGQKVKAQSDNEADDSSEREYVKAIYDMSKSISFRVDKPYINDFIFSLIPIGRMYYKALKTLQNYERRMIRERRILLEQEEDQDLDEKSRPAFLDVLLKARVNGLPLVEDEIREEMDTFMFEGLDTTSSAINWTVQLLGLHPKVQERAYEEITSVLGSQERVTNDHLTQLPYLEKIIKESLRLYPAVASIGRRLTHDTLIEGVTVPRGTDFIVNLYSLHHNPKYWNEPEVFNPDRWDEEAKVESFIFLPFSVGQRNCIGQKFAMNELKVVLLKTIQNFKITSRDKDPVMLSHFVLKPANGIFVTLEKRHKKED